MSKKRWSVLGLALGTLVLGLLVGLMTVGTVAADPAPGVRFQIPRIDIGGDDPNLDFPYDNEGYGAGDWGTWIHVQNVSPPAPVTGLEPATGAIFFGWRAPVTNDIPTPVCPPNDRGPFVAYCQLIQGNAVWTLRSQLDEEIKSAIIYSVPAAKFDEACDATTAALNGGTDAWSDWEAKYAIPLAVPGEELAITVNRYGEDGENTFISSTYTGISEDMDGGGYPFEYFAPYVMKGYLGLDTEFTIQNSGDRCTSVWIDYMEQTSCSVVFKWHIEQLAPGEAIRLRVPAEVSPPDGCGYGYGWLGSAHITAEQPLGVIVDQTSSTSNKYSPCFGWSDPGTLLTYRARPRVELRDEEPIVDYKHYADLIFREWSGWESSIQVQNLSREGLHTFVTVDFMDQSGDDILFLADWVCPGGSTTFYLPAVANLGFDYVGAADIESHDQISYPGQEISKQPIFAVVDLKKPADPLYNPYAQGGSYNAHPYSQKEWVDEIALPFIAKDAQAPDDPYTPWTSMIAIRNNSNCNKIKPTIWFKDETGRLLCEINSFWLHPKHLKLIDLENIGCLHAGYIGAAKVIIQPEDVEQLCDLDNDGHVDNSPTMPSVIVVSKGINAAGAGGVDKGDITMIYEGIPYSTGDKHCDADLLGMVIDSRTKEPLAGATITVPNGRADYHELEGRWVYTYTDAIGTTGVGGMYEIEDIVTFGTLEPAGTCYAVTVEATDYISVTVPNVCLSCGEDEVLDVQLVSLCNTVTVSGTVYDAETGLALDGAWVEITVGATVKNDTTENGGLYSVSDVPFDPDNTIKVCAGKIMTDVVEYTQHCETVYIPECDGSAVVDFNLHTEPDSRILLYWGNGGVEPAEKNYNDLKERYEAMDYIVDYQERWPEDTDLEEYKLVVLLMPGCRGDTGNEFNTAQQAQLGNFIHAGGRVVVLVDYRADLGAGGMICANFVDWSNVNTLLGDLSIGIVTGLDFTTDSYDQVMGAAETPYDTEFAPQHLEGTDGITLTLSGGAFDMFDLTVDNEPLDDVIAADKVGNPSNNPDQDCRTGWDVIVVGDADILADAFVADPGDAGDPPGWPENDAFADDLPDYDRLGACYP